MYLVGAAALCLGLGPAAARAQRGVGETTGVARLAVKPEIVQLAGTLTAIHTGPCEHTTGYGRVGVHLMVETADGKSLNIHLGPTTAVAFAVARLEVGQSIAIDAFRTEAMPADQFVAVRIDVGGESVTLRDETLRPVWAGRGFGARRGAASSGGWGRGGGRGYGHGRGWGGPCRLALYGNLDAAGAARYSGEPGDGVGRGRGWGYGLGYRRRGGW
jgi:hypothetical protein